PPCSRRVRLSAAVPRDAVRASNSVEAIASATPKNTAGRSRIGFARRDLDCRGAGTCTDHRPEIRTAAVLRAVCFFDAVVDGLVDRLESDLLRHSGGGDATGPLSC